MSFVSFFPAAIFILMRENATGNDETVCAYTTREAADQEALVQNIHDPGATYWVDEVYLYDK